MRSLEEACASKCVGSSLSTLVMRYFSEPLCVAYDSVTIGDQACLASRVNDAAVCQGWDWIRPSRCRFHHVSSYLIYLTTAWHSHLPPRYRRSSAFNPLKASLMSKKIDGPYVQHVYNGPLPSTLTLLSNLEVFRPGEKVRFLGWYVYHSLSTPRLEHT